MSPSPSNPRSQTNTSDSEDAFGHSSPPLNVPVEVLAAIFEIYKLTLNHDVRGDRDSDSDNLPPEVLVSHVNSYFRAVATSTPTLWRQLSIHGYSSLDKMATYLSRSSGCPLYIRAQLFADSLAERNRLDALLDLVIPHSPRWHSLCAFQGLETTEHPLLARLCNAYAPSLKYLTLEVEDTNGTMEEWVDQDISLPQIFEAASGSTLLEFVRLRGVAINYFRPQLTQTTTLHLEQLKGVLIQYRTLRTILATPYNLTNLSISGDIIPTGQWPLQPASIRLPNLLSLRIGSVSGEIYAGLLVVIHAPQLRSLYLKGVQDFDLDVLWIKYHGIAPTFPSVKKISFLDFDLSPAIFEKLCVTFPNITTFHTFQSPIEACQFVYLVLERPWERQGRTNILWPMLKHMTVREGMESKSDLRIHQFIEVRQRDGCALSSLTLLAGEDGEIPFYHSGVKIHLSSVVETWPDFGSSYLDLDDQWYI